MHFLHDSIFGALTAVTSHEKVIPIRNPPRNEVAAIEFSLTYDLV